MKYFACAKAWRRAFVACAFTGILVAGTGQAHAQSVDLVVTIQGDQPAYMAQDLEHFKVTISNNGPNTATAVQLVVDHPAADAPFELSATCQALPGPNPNGPATCPGGGPSTSAPSPFFVRSANKFSVTIPSIPSQSQVLVEFDNAADCISEGQAGIPERSCYLIPEGNFTVSADVSSAQSETDDTTNHATTNIYLYPPDIQYKVEITAAPTSATPGQVVEYDFEVSNFGLHPSNRLRLLALIKGVTGNMTAPTFLTSPYGNVASTLPGTELLSITCLPPSLGSYTLPMVFGALTDYCSSPPIPLPIPTSFTNAPPITGFPGGNFLTNLPGTQDGPPGGGVMRFRATVKVGNPMCVIQGESGHRDLEFNVQVSGLNGTDTVPPAFGDNSATAVTQVAKNCNEEADIQFTTSASPATVALNGGVGSSGGSASWTQTVTVSNISTGGSAATATQVPVTFGHHSYLFNETRTPVACTSSQPGLCPTASNVVIDTPAAFKLTTTLASLPAGQSVTFTQDVVATRTACWGISFGQIDLRGDAGPSPVVFDPNYLVTNTPPLNYAPGTTAYFGNNGMQTIATITNIPMCPGGGTTPGAVDLTLVKSGPYASAADAASNGPLIGQSAGTAIPDGSTIYFKLQATNPDGANPVMVSDIQDMAPFAGLGLMPGNAGFIHTGPSLSDWGIGCTASPTSQTCHELATSSTATGYNNFVKLEYDPSLHGGDTAVPLAPHASLTYILPFVTPNHLNRCTGPSQVQNSASARFSSASGGMIATPMSTVVYYLGNPPCTPGTLDIAKTIMLPATASSIPVSGLISHKLVLSNLSSTDTLDVAHLIDTPSANGATLQVVSISCQSLSNGAQCPVTPIVAGVKIPAVGAPSPLAHAYDIDYEWGSAGDNTFPPNSSLEVIVTYKLSNPTRSFGCLFNNARFSGEHDAFSWKPDDENTSACPPRVPDLSLQKTVSPQIAPPGSTVTYTLIVTNIGGASADGTQLVDPLPAALLADNPNGYHNVTCTDLSGAGYLPHPHGASVCPSVTSNASGLSATIATLGANSAMKFTYQAIMPDTPVAPLSVENIATVTPPAPDGSMSFNSGTAQSHQNVQVTAEVDAPPSTPVVVAVPALDRSALILMLLAMLGLGLGVGTRRMR